MTDREIMQKVLYALNRIVNASDLPGIHPKQEAIAAIAMIYEHLDAMPPVQPELECAVKDCRNNTNEGVFVGLLCYGCHEFISGEGDKSSQAYRNSKKTEVMQMQDLLEALKRSTAFLEWESKHIEGNMLDHERVIVIQSAKAAIAKTTGERS